MNPDSRLKEIWQSTIGEDGKEKATNIGHNPPYLFSMEAKTVQSLLQEGPAHIVVGPLYI